MAVKIKVCGMTRRADVEAAVEAGADALGFIFHPGSPRFVEPDLAEELTKGLPPYVQTVAVTVNLDAAGIGRIGEHAPFDVWQLHGTEPPGLARELRPRKLVKAFGLPFESRRVPDLNAYDVDAFLLDKASPRHGGTGETFDWGLARQFNQECDTPVILAGGIGLDNVEEAVAAVRPYAVDVCSSIEKEPGIKDHARMKELIRVCRQLP